MANLNISVDEESEDSSDFKTSVFQPVHVDDGGHKCDARKSKWSRPILQTETLSLVTVHDGSYIQEDRNQIFDTIYGVLCHADNLGTLGSTGLSNVTLPTMRNDKCISRLDRCDSSPFLRVNISHGEQWRSILEGISFGHPFRCR